MINKIINSEDPKYQSETISELVFDTTPTVNSFNTVTSDGIARAIAGASGEVPAVTENDNGKILTAVYDAGGPAVEWAEAQGGGSYTAGDGIAISNDEISASLSSSGGLMFDSDETNNLAILLAQGSGMTVDESGLTITNPVPDTTGASSGDVLTIGSNGPEWATPSGGGSSYTAGDGISIDNNEISAVLGNSSGGMQFDNDGIAIDWNYMESSSDGTLEAISDGVGGTSGIKVVNPVPDTTGASSGDVLTIGQNGPEWAAPGGGGSSTITAEKPIIGDGSASAPVKLLYSSNNMKASPDEYPLTVGSGTYGTCGTIEAYSTAIYEILPAPVQFMFTGIVSLGQQMTYRCYIYCPTTQARIYGNSATGAALGGRLYASLDVKNPGADSTGVFDGLSYQYDWEVGIEIGGAAGGFTGVTLYSSAKLNVKNPLPDTTGATSGDVLTIGQSGPEWADASLLHNTAGITDIVSVSTLPANPDAHTLYLVTGV